MISLGNLNNLNGLGQTQVKKGWYTDPSLALNSVQPSLIHNYTTEQYYDSSTGSTGFPFSATRTTNSTTFDSSGNLVWGPHQLCTRGQDLTNWSISGDGTIALSGRAAPTGSPSYIVTWLVASPTNGCVLGTQSGTTDGTYLTYSIYLRYVNHDWMRVAMYSSNNSSNQVRAWVNLETKTLGLVQNGGTASGATVDLEDVGDGWVRVTLTGEADWFNSVDGNLLFATTAGNGNTTRVGNGAAIEAASVVYERYALQAPQTWRNEFNTTGSAWYGERKNSTDGILIEPAATNLMTDSWLQGPATLTTTLGVATEEVMVGGWRGFNFVSNTTSGQHFIYGGSIGAPSSTAPYSASAIVGPSSNNLVQLTVSVNFGSSQTYINFNTSTGLITAQGTEVLETYVKSLGSGFYRIGFSFLTNAAASAGAPVILACITSATAIRLETHTSAITIRGCGAQLETGGVVTSLIPTFGASAARNGDILELVNSPEYVDTGMTYYADLRRDMFAYTGASSSYFVFGDASTNVTGAFGTGTPAQMRIDLVNAGVTQAQPSVSIGTAGTRYKLAGVIAPNNSVLFRNGAKGAVDSTVSMPASLPTTRKAIGRGNSASALQMNGWLKEFRIYKSIPANDAEGFALTTI